MKFPYTPRTEPELIFNCAAASPNSIDLHRAVEMSTVTIFPDKIDTLSVESGTTPPTHVDVELQFPDPVDLIPPVPETATFCVAALVLVQVIFPEYD